jgi:hypothetical protein
MGEFGKSGERPLRRAVDLKPVIGSQLAEHPTQLHSGSWPDGFAAVDDPVKVFARDAGSRGYAANRDTSTSVPL